MTARRPLLLDTSVAVALLVEDHEAHARSVGAVAGRRLGLSGHAVFETISVLTRLPGPARRPVAVVRTAVLRSFPESRHLSATGAAALVDEVGNLGIAGGQVFDALVAAAAREHGLTLATRDARALPTYHAVGAAVLLVE